jgi:hypothetical protein
MPEQEPDRIAFQVTAEAVPRETNTSGGFYETCKRQVGARNEQ